MPNINSNGKFGTSMDISQLLEISKAARLTAYTTTVNPSNSPLVKQNFGRDYRNRGFTSGVISVFMQKGLTPVFHRSIGGNKVGPGPDFGTGGGQI
jgi:hypothetical protein